jgi:tRNA-dependent cyclodipeptide synthase
MSVSSRANQQFAPPTGPYKVIFKNRVAWQGASEARLQISVGKPSVDGDKFFALCEWAAARFPRVVLIVSDTLQRHNLVFERALQPEDAHAESARLGEQWLIRNRTAIQLLKNPQILRWDEVLQEPRTERALAKLRQHVGSSDQFRSALVSTTNALWLRNEGKSPIFTAPNRECFHRQSREFLLEELAVFAWLCQGDGLDVYPGSWMENIFQALRTESDLFFDAFRKDWMQIDYIRNGAFHGDQQGLAA